MRDPKGHTNLVSFALCLKQWNLWSVVESLRLYPGLTAWLLPWEATVSNIWHTSRCCTCWFSKAVPVAAGNYCWQSLAEVIHINVYIIKVSIQDTSIAVLDGSCKPTNSPAAGTIVNAISNTYIAVAFQSLKTLAWVVLQPPWLRTLWHLVS